MKLIATLTIVLGCISSMAQEMVEQTFTIDESKFANPERGLYHHTEAHSENYSNLNLETLISWRESESITQVLRVFYLEKFREKAISQDYLNNVRKDLAIIRKAGLKCIMRFAYSMGTTAPYDDASPEMVPIHIGQLKPVFRENADVIQVLQAGFIGTWGEWYYTDYFSQAPGQLSDEDWQNRLEVVEHLLDALPKDRMVQVRTPGYKMNLFNSEAALTESNAFDGSNLSRIGHHNDCFVASTSDYGTYLNPEIEKPYLQQETRFTPMGGETCNVAPPISDCENSLSELKRFHWSYLNVDYNSNVLSEWENQGCYEEVELNLGYRIRLISASMTNQAKPLGSMNVQLTLINDGYANFYNKRKAHIILENSETEESYKVMLDGDPRLWPINEEFTLNATFSIPESMSLGTYNASLWMPDSYQSLADNPAYSVRMANQDIWDPATGYNSLHLTIDILDQAELPNYSSDQFFESLQSSSNIISIEGSSSFASQTGNSTILLSWPPQSENLRRIIQRSTDGVSFFTIASIPANSLYYKDLDISDNTYFYRYFISDGDSRTIFSDTIESIVSQESIDQILVDGSLEDWFDLPPSGSTIATDWRTFRVYFDSKNMNVFLQNSSMYQLFLDADNSTTTGDIQGMDYKFENGELFDYHSNNWVKVADLTTTELNGNIEFSTSLEMLTKIEGKIQFLLSGNMDTQQLMDADGEMIHIFRTLPPDTPLITSIQPDEFTPYSIELKWSPCSNCEGYFIERSTDPEGGFQMVKEYSSDRTSFRDFDLPETKQFYRMSSFNELGQSNYSETVSLTPQGPLSSFSTSVSPYPNPTVESVEFSRTMDQIWLYTIDGSLLESKEHVNSISLEKLAPGVYILQTSLANEIQQFKVIKQ